MMSKFQVLLHPVDVVIASGTRSLDALSEGEKGDPSPLAFAGALRTALMPEAERLNKKNLIGIGATNPDAPAGFRFLGPFLVDAEEHLLLPVPRPFVAGQGAVWTNWRLLAPEEGDYASDDGLACGVSILTTEDRNATPVETFLAPEEALYLLAKGALEEGDLKELARPSLPVTRGHILREEPRTGHARSSSGSVEEGGLFTRTALRFRTAVSIHGLTTSGYGGWVEVDESLAGALQSLAFVRLGGDGHMAASRVKPVEIFGLPDDMKKLLANRITGVQGFALYLATPAIFEKGWRPREETFAGWTLRGAALGRSVPVAGWDYARRAPRPVYRSVPAGATYFFARTAAEQLTEDAAINLVDNFSLCSSVSDVYPRLGFGYTLVAPWRPPTVNSTWGRA
jgi:CRISPR type III-B/RAMP module-associated protein Cmr3